MKHLVSVILLTAFTGACAGAIPRESVDERETLSEAPRAETENRVISEQPKSELEEGLPESTLPADDANAIASSPEHLAAVQKSRRILQGPSQTWEERTQTAEGLTVFLCDILLRGDQDGFRNILHSEAPKDAMRYWWNASSKGRYFRDLFAKCTFNNLDRRNSNSDHLKIYVKRWVKKIDRYTLPAPIRFRRDPKSRGSWRLISYSL